jgi:hypothetical protein
MLPGLGRRRRLVPGKLCRPTLSETSSPGLDFVGVRLADFRRNGVRQGRQGEGRIGGDGERGRVQGAVVVSPAFGREVAQ